VLSKHIGKKEDQLCTQMKLICTVHIQHPMCGMTATLTEVFPCFFLSCRANARVKLAKTGHGPHSSQLVVIYVILLLFVFSMLFVLFYALFVCKCVLYYCHRMSTKLQLTNIAYHNTGSNWTHCVNSKINVIWKQWCWNCLILLLNSRLTMLLGTLSHIFIVGSNAG